MSERISAVHSSRWRLAWYLLTITALSSHVVGYTFLNDDAYISFRYAANWVDWGELSYNLGERVEGYTNFLWVALLAASRALGAEIPLASLWLSALCSVLTLSLMWRVSERIAERRGLNAYALPLLTGLLLAFSPSFACWTSGGLEVQLFTLLFTMSLLASADVWSRTGEAQGGALRGGRAGALYALTALTRPEGVLLFGVAGLYRVFDLLRRRERWTRADSGGVLGFIVIYLPYFLWRYGYYGYPLPNTYYAKTGATGFWGPGLHYLTSWLGAQPWLLLSPLALWGYTRERERSTARGDQAHHKSEVHAQRAWVLLCQLTFVSSVALLIHVARVGGDFMALHRFLVPLLPLGALLAAVTVLHCTRSIPKALPVIMVIGLSLQLEVAQNQHRFANRIGSERGVDSIGWLRQFSEQCAHVGRWIKLNTDPQSTLATTAAGALPYYAERYTLDLLGLNDAWIAHNVPAKGHRPGHTKSAPFHYPLKRKVSYLIYHPTFSARPPRAHPRYKSLLKPWGYQWRSFQIPSLTPSWWSVWVHHDVPTQQSLPINTSSPVQP